ncbi:unnamed protein product [Closterium sp. NIES-54]
MMESETSTSAVSWLRLCAMARPSSLPSSALLMPQVRKARLMRSAGTAFQARAAGLDPTVEEVRKLCLTCGIPCITSCIHHRFLLSRPVPSPSVPQARYKVQLDPTVEEVKKLCLTCRRNAKAERVLFHYNGHGVPKPTGNGEIWVFNKTYTQYIPLSVYELDSWLASPSIYVFDCSAAGMIINAFVEVGTTACPRQADGQRGDLADLAVAAPSSPTATGNPSRHLLPFFCLPLPPSASLCLPLPPSAFSCRPFLPCLPFHPSASRLGFSSTVQPTPHLPLRPFLPCRPLPSPSVSLRLPPSPSVSLRLLPFFHCPP